MEASCRQKPRRVVRFVPEGGGPRLEAFVQHDRGELSRKLERSLKVTASLGLRPPADGHIMSAWKHVKSGSSTTTRA